MKSHLALYGGPKSIEYPLKRYNSIGIEEQKSVQEVLKSGNLSQFVGCWCEDFYGGPKVKEFEAKCAEYFGVRHAISVNSWTSGLIAAVGAIGIKPGDEIIVPTWTMCATATAILHWNAIPVFADIDPLTYNVSLQSIKKCLTPSTRAIIAVDIFGLSCDISEIMAFASQHSLKVITDTAQAPGSNHDGLKTGTSSHIGGYSLNYHKHIHTGEGGILVTNDDELALRLQLIRNHGEAAVSSLNLSNIANIIGYNFRMGEIEAAIGIAQLKKLDNLVHSRQVIATRLTSLLSTFPGIQVPYIPSNATHSYYVYPMLLDLDKLGASRSQIIKALQAEGLYGLTEGYANVHLLPMYQRKIAYGDDGFPWSLSLRSKSITYEKGICPTAEHYHDSVFMGFEMCLYELNDDELDLVLNTFEKVFSNIEYIR